MLVLPMCCHQPQIKLLAPRIKRLGRASTNDKPWEKTTQATPIHLSLLSSRSPRVQKPCVVFWAVSWDCDGVVSACTVMRVHQGCFFLDAMSCHLTTQKNSKWVWCRAGRGLGSRCFRRVSEPSGTSHSPKTPTQLLPAEAGSQHQAFS